MSLSRLWQQQGTREAARQLLTAVYGWFTEGFDAADLQDEGAAGGVILSWGADSRDGHPRLATMLT
jgi:hypothetical protein